jgi:hypothetical protein
MDASSFPNSRYRDLSPKRQAILRLIQCLGFGSVSFQLWSGEPDLGRSHHITRTVKLTGGDIGPRPEFASADFELRREHIALLSQLACLPDGTCVRVKVAHGLPGASIDIEEDHRAA